MAVLGPSFQIGRSALAAYQSAIAVVGQNIANVGNPDYTRQTARLVPLVGGPVLGGLAPGAGVQADALNRHIDEAVESRLRLALSARSTATTMHDALSQVESLFNELSDEDMSSQLSDLFSAFSELQTKPNDISARNLLVSAAQTLAGTFNRQRNSMLQMTTDLNESAGHVVRRADELAKEIAALNGQIVIEKSRGRGAAGPLQDRRDASLRELSEIMDIRTREHENGSVTVYAGSEPLVDFTRSRGLITQTVLDGGIERAEVRFADNNGQVLIREGKLAGILQARDVHLAGQISRLDQLANGLIYEVNRVHSSGRGLVGNTQATGNYDVLDIAAALNSTDAGLPFPVRNGTLIVNVKDTASGRIITRQINVDLDGIGGETSLSSLVGDLDGIPGLSAAVTTDNRLQVTADAGSEFWFSEDTSGALAALGVGSFFEGQDASDIAVDSAVAADARLITASVNGETGDGTNAGRLAMVGEAASGLLGSQAIEDFHAQTVNILAVSTAAAETARNSSDAVYSSLVAQREAISGVSLDEEAINLSKYEKSFQGASRFLGVLDQLTDEVLSLVR